MKWYVKKTSHHALVIDEKTGRNVALVYDPEDAPHIAAALELLELLESLRIQHLR